MRGRKPQLLRCWILDSNHTAWTWIVLQIVQWSGTEPSLKKNRPALEPAFKRYTLSCHQSLASPRRRRVNTHKPRTRDLVNLRMAVFRVKKRQLQKIGWQTYGIFCFIPVTAAQAHPCTKPHFEGYSLTRVLSHSLALALALIFQKQTKDAMDWWLKPVKEQKHNKNILTVPGKVLSLLDYKPVSSNWAYINSTDCFPSQCQGGKVDMFSSLGWC